MRQRWRLSEGIDDGQIARSEKEREVEIKRK